MKWRKDVRSATDAGRWRNNGVCYLVASSDPPDHGREEGWNKEMNELAGLVRRPLSFELQGHTSGWNENAKIPACSQPPCYHHAICPSIILPSRSPLVPGRLLDVPPIVVGLLDEANRRLVSRLSDLVCNSCQNFKKLNAIIRRRPGGPVVLVQDLLPGLKSIASARFSSTLSIKTDDR